MESIWISPQKISPACYVLLALQKIKGAKLE